MATRSNVSKHPRSLRQNGGARTMASVKTFDRKQQAMDQEPEVRYASTPNNAGIPAQQQTRDFAVQPFPRQSEADTYQLYRDKLLAAHKDERWQYNISDRDIQYVKEKEQIQERASFDLWSSRFWADKDPSKVQWFKKLVPDYFERRKAALKDKYDLAYQVACLYMMGPQSHKDLELMWAMDTGRIKLPKALWDPKNLTIEDEGKDQFQRGPYSPMKWAMSFGGGKVGINELFSGKKYDRRATGDLVPGMSWQPKDAQPLSNVDGIPLITNTRNRTVNTFT
jgi:hypothetical protein